MSLVKYDNKPVQSTWTKRDKKAIRHKIPGSEPRPVIDYAKLKQLCAIKGLQTVKNPSTAEAHEQFMDSYKQIFVEDEKLTGNPIHSLTRSLKRLGGSQSSVSTTCPGDTSQSVIVAHDDAPPPAQAPDNPTNTMSHDIRDYMAKLHKQRQSEDPEAIKRDRIRLLRRLLKKLPFERSAAENEQILGALKHVQVLSEQVPAQVLKELCVVAQLDVWKEPDLTIFGNTGFHFVLKGKVKPITDPWVKFKGEQMEFRSPTPEPEVPLPELGVGDVFGTLEKVEGRESNTRILSVTTTSEVTEFLRISTNDYKRVIDQIRQRDETEKVNLLQSCKAYQYWSKQPLVKVANLLDWATFPANTVLVSEGYKAPFVAIIKSGECHVLRHVDVLKELPNGQKEKRTKQVVMGKLKVNDSFGEISVITDEPITCSIVTSAPVQLAVIEPDKLKELDETTVQLLQQSSERTFGDLTTTDIHNEYVTQELKREWNEFKHTVISDVLNARGVRPGYGKWAKN